MSLNNTTDLTPQLAAAFSSYPATVAIAASLIGTAYNGYAIKGQSCSGLFPTLVFLSKLIDGLQTTMETETTVSAIAQGWADAFVDYWTGALFGTGSVTLIGGSVALKTGLENLWNLQVQDPATTFLTSAAQHSTLLDIFTKTVTVADPTIPCTAPII